ncbi:MAG TPA: hypothetical protein DFH32_07990 [Lachnospiraceae bacterium]|nr:hypothetical protein [Lachnospiraceae bacterium]HCX40834.1 hypothetical protein [Lachnospiraceae bacterium]
MNKYIQHIVNELKGKIVKIKNAEELSGFLEQSKKIADQEWLYHCTDRHALMSILKNREFYLKNLVYVNDEEEADAIDVNEYRNTFYVGCFSSEIVDTPEHSEEYGKTEDSVIIAMKKEWFTRDIHFLDSGEGKWGDLGDTFRIFPNMRDVMAFQRNELIHNRFCYPYYIDDYGFYGIIYDDNEKQSIKCDISLNLNGTEIKGITFIPELAGIIKKKSGISKRTQKMRMWSDEKEIRLKVCIHQIDHIQNGMEYHDDAMVPITIRQVVVKLTENAFNSLYIYFPSTFIDKEGYIEDLKTEIPRLRISVMDEASRNNPLKNKEQI